jgi:hypothetical protein
VASGIRCWETAGGPFRVNLSKKGSTGAANNWDRKRGAYVCPNGKLLRTSGTLHDGRTLLYRASKRDCDATGTHRLPRRGPKMAASSIAFWRRMTEEVKIELPE